jgi:hypothetical protein
MYWESGGKDPCAFLTSAIDGGEQSASRAGRFTPGKEPLHRRLDRTQSRSGRCCEEKKILSLSGIETRSSSP